jgi:hypothetical protein
MVLVVKNPGDGVTLPIRRRRMGRVTVFNLQSSILPPQPQHHSLPQRHAAMGCDAVEDGAYAVVGAAVDGTGGENDRALRE